MIAIVVAALALRYLAGSGEGHFLSSSSSYAQGGDGDADEGSARWFDDMVHEGIEQEMALQKQINALRRERDSPGNREKIRDLEDILALEQRQNEAFREQRKVLTGGAPATARPRAPFGGAEVCDFRVVDVTGDGLCFWRALLDGMEAMEATGLNCRYPGSRGHRFAISALQGFRSREPTYRDRRGEAGRYANFRAHMSRDLVADPAFLKILAGIIMRCDQVPGIDRFEACGDVFLREVDREAAPLEQARQYLLLNQHPEHRKGLSKGAFCYTEDIYLHALREARYVQILGGYHIGDVVRNIDFSLGFPVLRTVNHYMAILPVSGSSRQ